ncbi:MAG: DUF1343 domain-containing protein, partial [Chitinophagaceae bacterium]
MRSISLAIGISFLFGCSAQKNATTFNDTDIRTGAERTEVYLPFLKNKRVGIFANPTSVVGKS